MLLPGSIAHHRHRCGAGPVVRGRNRAPGKCADTERREVIARNELAFKWFRGSVRAAAARAQFGQATLKCGQLAELRRVIAELLIERVGINVPVFLQSPKHAAIVAAPEAVQVLGILHRQRLEHHRVHQREDGRVGPDTQSQRQHADDGKPRRLPQPAESITKRAAFRYVSGAGSQPARDSQSRLDISNSPANAELRAPRGLGVPPASSPYSARLSSNSSGPGTYIEATKRIQGESGKTGIPRPHYTYHYQTVARRPQGQQEPSNWTDSAAYSKKISPFVIFMLHSRRAR